MLKFFLADDHQMFRQGLFAMLNRTGKVTIIGEAADGHLAIQKIAKLQPDIAILDQKIKVSQEIANLLCISPQTVDTHRKNIMAKLDIHSVAGLVKYALRHGYISLQVTIQQHPTCPQSDHPGTCTPLRSVLMSRRLRLSDVFAYRMSVLIG